MPEKDPTELDRLLKQAKRRKRAGELVGGRQFETDRNAKIDELLEKEWLIADFDLRKGKFGVWAVILLMDPETGEKVGTATGGEVVVRKLEELREGGNLPVMGQFVKPGTYYDLI